MSLRRLQGSFEEKLKGSFKGGFKEDLKGRLQEMNFIFFVFNPPKASSCGFLLLWGGKHVFVHFLTA